MAYPSVVSGRCFASCSRLKPPVPPARKLRATEPWNAAPREPVLRERTPRFLGYRMHVRFATAGRVRAVRANIRALSQAGPDRGSIQKHPELLSDFLYPSFYCGPLTHYYPHNAASRSYDPQI
jgi:hypothetical protein